MYGYSLSCLEGGEKMKKNLRKNKKGFTLVEIIVVLLIIGILLAITIPSIMGYVGKAREAQYIAEGRSGYVAAQTILAKEAAGKTNPTGEEQAAILAKVNSPLEIAKELGELGSDAEDITPSNTVQSIYCDIQFTGSTKVKGCSIQTAGTGKGDKAKFVNFTAGTDSNKPDASVSDEPTYKAN